MKSLLLMWVGGLLIGLGCSNIFHAEPKNICTETSAYIPIKGKWDIKKVCLEDLK